MVGGNLSGRPPGVTPSDGAISPTVTEAVSSKPVFWSKRLICDGSDRDNAGVVLLAVACRSEGKVLTEAEAVRIVQTAEVCSQHGKFNDALRLLQQLFDAVNRTNEAWVVPIGIRMYTQTSFIHDELGRAKESHAFLSTLVKWLQNSIVSSKMDPTVQSAAEATLRGSEAKLMQESGHVEEAIVCYQRLLQYLAATRPQADEWELGNRCDLVSILYGLGRFAEIMNVARSARSRREGLEPSDRLAALSLMEGSAALATGDFEDAEEAYQVALNLSEALNDPIRQAIALEKISFALRYGMENLKSPLARLDRSISTRRQAINLYQRANDHKAEIEARTQLIHILMIAKLVGDAINECVLASRRCEVCGDLDNACSFIAHAGHLSTLSGKRKEAAELYKQALAQYGSSASPQLERRIRTALANLLPD
jgi:tetratricopeptide (TPR) repeat protein